MQGFEWQRVTDSVKISSSHVCVGELILTDDGGGHADITLYDGESDQDPPILTIRATQNQSRPIIFQPYLVTKRGLYISVGSNVSELLILFSQGNE